jgi:hypothetical protein
MRPCREEKISPKQISFALFLFSVKWCTCLRVLKGVWCQHHHGNKVITRIFSNYLTNLRNPMWSWLLRN